MPPAKPCVLLAARPVACAAVRQALGDDAEIVDAHTMDAALEHLQGSAKISLVVCTVYFDDSRMFDLLRYVRSASRRRDQPVICLRSLSHRTSAISSESLKIACEALGADAFLDFGAYASEAAADAALGQAANGLLKQGRDC
jgi:CheY-like chemotaxis protein